MKRLVIIFSVLSLVAISACKKDEVNPEEAAAGVAPAAEKKAEAPAAAKKAEVKAAEGSCEQAKKCCAEYVKAVGGNNPAAGAACNSIDKALESAKQAGNDAALKAADQACDKMVGMWKQSMEAAKIEIPASCN